jgi:hypothetical protein
LRKEIRSALRDEGPNPDDPAVIAATDLVRWELLVRNLVTAAGSSNVHVPSAVAVDFSRDRSGPIRTLKIEVQQGVAICTEIRLSARRGEDAKPIEAICDEFDLKYRTPARYVELCRSDEFGLVPTPHRGKRRA